MMENILRGYRYCIEHGFYKPCCWCEYYERQAEKERTAPDPRIPALEARIAALEAEAR